MKLGRFAVDGRDVRIVSRVNGETMQDGSSSLMVRSVAELTAFVSSHVRLEPGDIIATGTPEGVGTFQEIRLHDGDTVEIADVGTLVNQIEETE